MMKKLISYVGVVVLILVAMIACSESKRQCWNI